MISYPKTKQLCDVIRSVKASHDYRGRDDNDKPIYLNGGSYPVLEFTGTVKLHGTNIGFHYSRGKFVSIHGRSIELTPEQDNYGVAKWADNLPDKVFDYLAFSDKKDETYTVFGEWCGEGIQKGVAINQLPKMFVIFGIYLQRGDEKIQVPLPALDTRLLNPYGIYDVRQFGKWDISIDFNNPQATQQEIHEYVTEVEAECPCGKFFGVDGIGEGIVWKCFRHSQDSVVMFKSKGQKHSATKTRVISPVDVEKVAGIEGFVSATCTESRFRQGIEELKYAGHGIIRQNTGEFLSWVMRDIRDEDMESLKASWLRWEDVRCPIAHAARAFWLRECNVL